MKKWLAVLFVAGLFVLATVSAFAEIILEPMSVFGFSAGIDGNFRFTTTQTKADVSGGAMYFTCMCGKVHDADDIETWYEVSTIPEFYYTLEYKKAEREYHYIEEGNGGPARGELVEWYEMTCTPIAGKETAAGEYPLTFTIHAKCGEHIGWAECTIPMYVRGPGEQESEYDQEYNDSWKEFFWKLEYSADKTYSFGDEGRTVWFIQKALEELRYFDEEVDGHFGSRTLDAVRRFQRAQNLLVTGVCDEQTMSRLFRLYLGNTEIAYEKEYFNPEWDAAGTKEWLNKIGVKTGAVVKLVDLWTDLAINVELGYIDGHMDAKPVTPADTRSLCRMYGVSSCEQLSELFDQANEKRYPYNGRPMLLVVSSGGKKIQIVCSINAAPHGGYATKENGYAGQFCIYLNGSRIHGVNRIDDTEGGHQEMISIAAKLMEEKNGATVGIGEIVSDKNTFDNMPPVEVPTLVMPDNTVKDANPLIKFQQSENRNTIVYNVHMSNLEGEELELLKQCRLYFPYPEGIDENSADKARIIIHHYASNGKTEVFKSEDGEIEFTRQGLCIPVLSFSPFEIRLGDDADAAGMPMTGDHSSIMLYSALLILSAAGIAAMAKKRRTE